MPVSISRKTAQQIVETVRDVCGRDVNFIAPDGRILASSNPARIDTYHEVGRQAAREGRMIEVDQTQVFAGTKSGVNLPFYDHGELVAVIGITGEPQEVRRYAYLATRITSLILRERELSARNRDRQDQITYLVRSLTGGQPVNHDYFRELFTQLKVEESALYQTLIVQISARYNPANLSLIERQIREAFSASGSSLRAFEYPGTYLLLATPKGLSDAADALQELADEAGEILRIGIGTPHSLHDQNLSRNEAELALRSASGSRNLIHYEDLTLEILVSSVPRGVCRAYLARTLGKLDEKERQILAAYLECDRSLKRAAARLYLHPNTVQYQLERITRDCGLNPRVLHDTVALYLALELEKLRGEEREDPDGGESAPAL